MHQPGVAAGDDDLRAPGRLFHSDDDDTHAFARGVALQPRLLAPRHAPFGLAQVDDDVAVLETLDDAVDNLADMPVVFLIHAFALGFADLLEDHLLGHLGRDPAQALGRLLELQLVIDLDVVLQRLGFLDGNLQRLVLDLFHDLPDREHFDFARIGVEP